MAHMKEREANLLGTVALTVADLSREACAAEAGSGGEASAGLLAVATFLSGCSIEQLSRALNLSHSATVRLVDKLEKEDLVRREEGRDGRSVALSATARGRRRAEQIAAARESVLETLLAPLSKPERAELTRLHEKLLGGIVGEGIDPTRICRLCNADACGHDTGRCPVTEAGRSLLRA